MTKKTFGTRLTDAVRIAVASLEAQRGDEHLYAFALYTSGQEDFDYVCASANTTEALARSVASSATRRAEQGRETSVEEIESALRWSAPDWELHDFSPEVSAIELPPQRGDRDERDHAVYSAFVKALGTADAEGLFGKGASRARVTLAVMCGDMSADFLLKSIEKLNPPAVVKRYVDAHTPASLYRRLDALPADRRASAYLELYADLAFHRSTPNATLAKRVGLTYFGQLDEKIAALGPQRSALDEEQEGIVSTLAENIARVLHALDPARFVAPKKDPKTNRLLNAHDYV